MTAKSVLLRPQGLRPRARAPLAPFATPLYGELIYGVPLKYPNN